MGRDVIVACDFSSAEQTLAFLDRFTGRKPFVKIGMELFYAEGPEIVRQIKARGHKIFLDLKLHDIPNTVKSAMRVLSRLDVDMVNLHAAGTIDMICREADGTFAIYDWKRSKKVVNAYGQPIVEAFGGKTDLRGLNLPDTSFYHYCLQQNLYRYMLQKNYGIRISALNLVVLCPDYPTYFVAKVPIMDNIIQQIVSICRERDLGHQLLK